MKNFLSEKVLTPLFLLIISLLLAVIVFLLVFPQQKEDSIIFSYPNSPLEFA
jgi:preprotein translocase subunit YajC